MFAFAKLCPESGDKRWLVDLEFLAVKYLCVHVIVLIKNAHTWVSKWIFYKPYILAVYIWVRHVKTM